MKEILLIIKCYHFWSCLFFLNQVRMGWSWVTSPQKCLFHVVLVEIGWSLNFDGFPNIFYNKIIMISCLQWIFLKKMSRVNTLMIKNKHWMQFPWQSRFEIGIAIRISYKPSYCRHLFYYITKIYFKSCYKTANFFQQILFALLYKKKVLTY